MEVLAVTASSGLDAQNNSTSADSEEEKKLPSTLTLLVLPQQAQLLADLESKGTLHTTLVYRGDPNTAKAFTDKQAAYFTAKQAASEESAHD
ncbi:hypothetical protein D3C75_1246090 [compost metagenome]